VGVNSKGSSGWCRRLTVIRPRLWPFN